MLNSSNCSKSFWAEAVIAANYIQTRCSHRAINGKTPYEVQHGKKLSLEHIRAWGCDAYVYVDKVARDKLDPNATKCKLIGYEATRKAYRLWDYQKQKVIISRHVIFDESSITKVPKVEFDDDYVVVEDASSGDFKASGRPETSPQITEIQEPEPENSPKPQTPTPQPRRSTRNEGKTTDYREPDLRSQRLKIGDPPAAPYGPSAWVNQGSAKVASDGIWALIMSDLDTSESEKYISIDPVEPLSYKEAKRCKNAKQWDTAMKKEL